jgi:hypothetical protein
MARPAKRYEVDGKMLTIAQISRATGIAPLSVHSRIRRGQSLSEPKRDQRAGKDAMCDDAVDFDHDIECRISRAVCGGTCTQMELAALWDISHQAIDRLEKRAVEKIRGMAQFSEDAVETLKELETMRDARATSFAGARRFIRRIA